MPTKIQFQCVYSTSSDEQYPASELNHHEQFVNGWQSSRSCSYPQELIFQFESHVRLKRLQLLSHQYLIASKIEFHVGNCSSDEELTYKNARYTNLGFIELSTNELTDFKARELKSIHVDVDGLFLKIVLHKNHNNRYNVHNQVSLIAINLLGDDIDKLREIHDNQIDLIPNRSDQISIVDDLAFAMFQDPEIAAIIRNLDKKKQEYVQTEKFDQARKFKQAIQELLKIGERLARYEMEKRQAIEREDYDTAQNRKEKVELFRTETYKQLQALNLLDIVMESGEGTEFLKRLQDSKNNEQQQNDDDDNDDDDDDNDDDDEPPRSTKQQNHARPQNLPQPRRSAESAVSYAAQSIVLEPLPSSPLPPIVTTMKRASIAASISGYNSPLPPITSSVKRGSVMVSRNEHPLLEYQKPSTPYEDKIIPTLRHRIRSDGGHLPESALGQYDNVGKKNFTDIDTISRVMSTVPADDATAELNQAEMIEANQMMIVFDKQLVSKLYHRNHIEREEALEEIYQILNTFSGNQEDARAYLRAGSFVLARMFRVDVLAIFSQSVKLFHLLMNDYVQRHSIQRQDIITSLERVLPVLLQRTGDSNARLRLRAIEAIIESATYPELKPLQVIPHHCVFPFNKTCAPRLAISRCELIEELMKILDVQKGDNGLNVDNVGKFCAQALEHNAGEVRELAIKLLLSLYKIHGAIVKRYLPPNNDQTRRMKKYRDMFDAFDKMDAGMEKESNSNSLDGVKKVNDPNDTLKRDTQKQMHTARDQLKPSEVRASVSKSRTPTRFDRKTPTASVADESEFTPENTCIFCGEKNEDFIRSGLETHYWASCPMLRRCQECNQVVEIGIYIEHLLRECAKKGKYQQCPRCTEAIGNDFDNHIKLKECYEAKANTNRCPLCHMNVHEGEKAWHDHLMGVDGCIKNPRRMKALNKNKTSQQQQKSVVVPTSQVNVMKKQRKVSTTVK
ncbi:unnamed protein product [Adineta steineri]|uniref:TOG domain-containing protein n=1 Tax=Adineta steineri TaxID=433720 RepID=A0A814RSJ7_9BILA|nr:unnamed protein product [Adineta steineri]CAF1528855.1 unnamed protein product [Adineta steineri]